MGNGIQGSIQQKSSSLPTDEKTLAMMLTKPEVQKLTSDLHLLINEYSNDKNDIMRESSNDRFATKAKIDALAWYGRCLCLVTTNQVLDALTLFKKSVLPAENPTIRNAYVKMIDHGSNAAPQLCSIIKTESLNEKLAITGNVRNGNQSRSVAHSPTQGRGAETPNNELITDFQNQSVQRKLFQLLSIIEPILLNDENTNKAINCNFIETLSDMLIFQSTNLMNIQRKINMN